MANSQKSGHELNVEDSKGRLMAHAMALHT